jgi:hypothetical protein
MTSADMRAMESLLSTPGATLNKDDDGPFPTAAAEDDSGVADMSRLAATRFLFWAFVSLDISFLEFALLAAPVFFLSCFSGAGHSTSLDRSSLWAGIHSRRIG